MTSWILIYSALYCYFQVDGEYEDWLEVLRLIYHSGKCLTQGVILSHEKFHSCTEL